MSDGEFQSFQDLKDALGLGQEFDVFATDWSASQEIDAEKVSEYLSPQYVQEACTWLEMSPQVVEALIAGVSDLRDSKPLQRLFWHCHTVLFRQSPGLFQQVPQWPMLPVKHGQGGQLLYAYVFLSGLEYIKRLHRQRAIPQRVTIDTLFDLDIWIREHHKRHGVWGFSEQRWLQYAFRSGVYRLGRLQYEPNTFDEDFHVLRHRDGTVLMLAGQGMRFRNDGQFDGCNEIRDAEAWTASFERTESEFVGYAISPRGWATRKLMRLPADEWSEVLKKGDSICRLHIPALGALKSEMCRESLAQAPAFFEKHFPELDLRGYTCHSWLLDSQLEDYLDPQSNIVHFLQEFYLYPAAISSERQTLDIAFDGKFQSIETAPQNNSLQRAVIKHMQNGGRWRTGAGFLLCDGPAWGEKEYRSLAEKML